MKRREFLRTVKGSVGLLAAGGGFWTLGCQDGGGPMAPEGQDPIDLPGRARLPIPETVSPTGLSLVAQPGSFATPDGDAFPAWMYRDSIPGPTIRVRTGERIQATLQNGLPEVI